MNLAKLFSEDGQPMDVYYLSPVKNEVEEFGEHELVHIRSRVLTEGLVKGRLYEIPRLNLVARFVGDYDDYILHWRHHAVHFYLPIDETVNLISDEVVKDYLDDSDANE